MKNHLVVSDKKRRLGFMRTELTRLRLKYVLCDLTIIPSLRFFIFLKFQRFPRSSSRVGLNNRCFVTGRSAFVCRSFGLSRHEFRRLSLKGALVGIRKSS